MLLSNEQYTLILKHEYVDENGKRHELEKPIKVRYNEPVGCNGCRYDWSGDPRCAKCARSFQDHYEV